MTRTQPTMTKSHLYNSGFAISFADDVLRKLHEHRTAAVIVRRGKPLKSANDNLVHADKLVTLRIIQMTSLAHFCLTHIFYGRLFYCQNNQRRLFDSGADLCNFPVFKTDGDLTLLIFC